MPQVIDTPQIPHANLHSCRVEAGACTPNVQETPGLVTVTPAQTGAFTDLGTGKHAANFESTILLKTGEWSLIAHFQVAVADGTMYDIIGGARRTVLNREQLLAINGQTREVILALGGLAFAVHLVILVVVFWKRKHKVLRAASNTFCLGIIFWGMVGVASVFGFSDVSDAHCLQRPFFLSLSFTGVFGLLFAKTYRVYRIFTSFFVVSLTNLKLYVMWSVLMLIDLAILLVWTFMDPLTPKRVQDSQLTYQYHWQCSSEHESVFYAVIGVEKLLLLACGVYLAFRTRKTSTLYNESRYITFAMYTYAILLVTSVPAVFLVDDPEVVFILLSSFILVAVTSTTLVLFVPKLYLIFTKLEEDIQDLSDVGTGSRRSGLSTTKTQLGELQVRKGRLPRALLDFIRTVHDSTRDILGAHEQGLSIKRDQVISLSANYSELARTLNSLSWSGGGSDKDQQDSRHSGAPVHAAADAKTAAAGTDIEMAPAPSRPVPNPPRH